MPYATRADSVRIFYQHRQPRSGTAAARPPLLFIHGSGLTNAMWRGLGYFAAFADREVLAMDLRGHGRSDKVTTPAAYRISTLAEDVIAVLDAARVGAADIHGYSAGARIALYTAWRHPERVHAVAAGAPTYESSPGLFGRTFFPGVETTLCLDGMEQFVTAWEKQRGRPLEPSTRSAYLTNDAQALSAYMAGYELEPSLPRERLSEITAPAYLYVGAEDTERIPQVRTLAQLIPRSAIDIIAGQDHHSAPNATALLLPRTRAFFSAESESVFQVPALSSK